MMKKSEELKHVLVPKHEICSEKEKNEILERYNVSLKQLPRISRKDPAISHLEAESGDVVKIIRKNQTSGSFTFYRVVSNV
jgi:DNA-directed RNA polymerase subunit H (RpoH/RPB5)